MIRANAPTSDTDHSICYTCAYLKCTENKNRFNYKRFALKQTVPKQLCNVFNKHVFFIINPSFRNIKQSLFLSKVAMEFLPIMRYHF